MEKRKLINYLRIKAMALSMVGIMTLTGCGNFKEETKTYKYNGYIYLVPYQNHLYVVIDEEPEDEHLQYNYKVIGYEGGSNKHFLEFYKRSGEKFGDKWHACDVYSFDPNDESQMNRADELLKDSNQEPLSDKLPKNEVEESKINILSRIIKKEEIKRN